MLTDMEAQYLGFYDRVSFNGERATIVSAYTYAGVYGDTTELEYRYDGAQQTSTVRMNANTRVEML